MKRCLFCLIFVMSVFSDLFSREIYLDTGGETLWGAAGAKFAVWSWYMEDGAFSDFMTNVEGNIYVTTIPDEHTNLIFVRFPSNLTSPSWSNKWNQTNDLTIGEDNLYVITSFENDGGYWSKYNKKKAEATEPLILTYNDTALSADQIKQMSSNPVKLIYPTKMKSKIPAMQCADGISGLGPFSVAEGRQVMFSPGNLQFNAAQGTHKCADGTTQHGTWRFAEHQWDYVGDSINGTVYIVVGTDSTKCDNTKISETYNGWIDLFGWGTSGWNNTANDPYAVNYQPWSTSTSTLNTSNYYGYGPSTNQGDGNLTGSNSYFDWGVYNQIGSDAPGTWRTLTREEWVYLFHERVNAEKLFGLGSVNGVNGTIILPDDWVTPSGLSFTPSTESGFTWSSSRYIGSNGFSHNTYTESQWAQMEQRGAVFLPAAGNRFGTSVYDFGSNGGFWSASQISGFNAYYLYFNSSYLSQYTNGRDIGFSLRLVSDL